MTRPRVPGYVFAHELGRGRHSVAYSVHPECSPAPELDRVAAKCYPLEYEEEARRIAELWQQIDSPHVPRYLDVLQVDVDDSARITVVIPFLGGGSLEALMERRRLRPGEAITILAPIADVLLRVAELGRAHGAVEPSTIHFDDAGAPVLLGWGRAPERASPFDDALQYIALCREALGEPAWSSAGVDALVAPAHPVSLAVDLGALRDFYQTVEDDLFALAEPEPVDPLHPYDWQADATRALASIEAGIDEQLSAAVQARRPLAVARARLSSVSGRARVMSAMVVQRRRIPLWPGGRVSLSLKSAIVAVTVGVAALTCALVVPTTPSRASGGAAVSASASARTSRPGEITNGGAAPSTATVSAGASSAANPPSLTPSAATPPSLTPSAATSSSGAPSIVSSSTPVPNGAGPDDVRASGLEGVEDDAVLRADDAGAAAIELLSRRDACYRGRDETCLAEVDQAGSSALAFDQAALRQMHGSSGASAGLAIDTLSGQRVGDVVLFAGTASATQQPASLLLVKGETGWRIREVFMPSG